MNEHVEQLQFSQAELLGVAQRLARALVLAAPGAATIAADEINAIRRGLGESSQLETQVTARLLGEVEKTLRKRE